MKLQITDSLETSIGVSFANMVASVDLKTDNIADQGKGKCYLKVWATDAANIAEKNQVQIVGVTPDFEVQFTEAEIVTTGISLTLLYGKVKDYLELTYGWTINII